MQFNSYFQDPINVWHKDRPEYILERMMWYDTGSNCNWISRSLLNDLGAQATQLESPMTFSVFSDTEVSADRQVQLFFQPAGYEGAQKLKADFLVADHKAPKGMEILLGSDDCKKYRLVERGPGGVHVILTTAKPSPGTPQKKSSSFSS